MQGREMRMRTVFALVTGIALSLMLGAQPALAGFTILEKEFVGNTENANKVGGGDASAATEQASRFAGSNNTIAEGPPPGDGGPDASGGEFFTQSGVLPVQGGESVNGFPVFQNIPSCPDPTGAGLDQVGLPARFGWDFRLERPVVSDIQLQICLDVRKCQEEDDDLGQASTVSIRDFVDGVGWEAPVIIRVSHQRGSLNPESGVRGLPNLVVPGLEEVGPVSLPSDLGASDDPDQFEIILEEAVSFVGRDCITKWIPNDGRIAAQDRIDVDLLVPSSTRVRVRASQDAAALCYLGTPLPGEDLSDL